MLQLYSIEADPNDTIGALKAKLHAQEQVGEPGLQKFIFQVSLSTTPHPWPLWHVRSNGAFLAAVAPPLHLGGTQGKVLADATSVSESAINEGDFIVLMLSKPKAAPAAPDASAAPAAPVAATATEAPAPAPAAPASVPVS